MNSISKYLGACVLAIGVASSASAATTTFSTPGSSVAALDGPNYTITAGVNGIFNNSALVSQTSQGLGVAGSPDTEPGQIDGFPVFSSETLLVTFDYAVKLVQFTLGRLDGNDDFTFYLDGVSQGQIGPGVSNPFLVGQNITSFAIEASGTFSWDDFFIGNDNFTLASFETASVPLPATLPLILAALGGLGIAARRRRAA